MANPAAAYAQVQTPKQLEAAVFSLVVRRLKEAKNSESVADKIRAASDANRLWNVVLDLVLDANNMLPKELRASIASVANAAIREANQIEPDIEFLIEVTDNMAKGLRA